MGWLSNMVHEELFGTMTMPGFIQLPPAQQAKGFKSQDIRARTISPPPILDTFPLTPKNLASH